MDDAFADHVPYYVTFSARATGDEDIEAPQIHRNPNLVAEDTLPAEPLDLLEQTFQAEESPYPAGCEERMPRELAAGDQASGCQIFLLPAGDSADIEMPSSQGAAALHIEAVSVRASSLRRNDPDALMWHFTAGG